jgi:hypothetical protein
MQADTFDRYVFDSPTKARLQEIGPRFTLKLRWLKNGLPAVTAPDGRIAHGGDAEDSYQVNEAQEKADEDDAMGDIGKPAPTPTPTGDGGPIIPPLDQEQEYEWKWRVSLIAIHLFFSGEANYRRDADDDSQRWRFRGELSFCRSRHTVLCSRSLCNACISYPGNIISTSL